VNATPLMITTVLLDLDGVVRHFDPLRVAEIEERHGLTAGQLMAAGFAPDLLEPVITGATTRSTWTEQVGEAVGNPAAAAEWLAGRGTVDAEMLGVVAELRTAGVTVAVLTNGTDSIPLEMEELGLVVHFDAIFNSASIGFAKPDVRAFGAVCDALDVAPEAVFFTDDSASKLSGAIEVGMTADLFTSSKVLVHRLTTLGLLPAP